MINLIVISFAFAFAPAQEPSQEPDGAALYAQNCAVCHGPQGGGDGTVKFDPPARSFIDGGFSFGNTPTALFNTISNGIGGTPMPPFKDVLTEEEVRAVVSTVISFSPIKQQDNKKAAVLNVTTRPRVIRGGLQAYHDAEAVIPRGLVLGGLDGLNVEYDTETMAILAFRRGGFVQRNDWGDRGGALLDPLGELLLANSENENSWGLFSAAGYRDLWCDFVATEVDELYPKVIYRLVDSKNNQDVAEVSEWFEFAKERYSDEDVDYVINKHISIKWLSESDSSLFYGASYLAPDGWRVGRGLRLDQTELNKPHRFLYQFVKTKPLDDDQASSHSNND
ncbi:MAG: c-type cytochrome [Planctomycetota bacterium]|nr:c-type cytochrome [Planctomycetota bacterium]